MMGGHITNSITASAVPVSEDFWNFDSLVVFDCLEGKRRYLLSGKNGSQIKLSGSAYCLLQSARIGQSFADLADTLNKREGEKKVSEEELKEKLQLLLEEMRRIEMNATRGRLPWGFWMRFRLIGEDRVVKIAAVASKLFHPVAAICALALLLGGTLLSVQKGFAFTFPAGTVLPGFGLFLIVVMAHEFGHASACARYGARPSDIGFALYLVYPAFYSDVSAAWKLSRGQRVVVDLGGCYFQAMITALFVFAYYRTGWEAFHVAILLSLYSALSSLNPIFKFDGYWVLADLLGVTNLSSQPRRIRKYLVDVACRRPTPGLPWPTFVTVTLTVYSGLAVTVWALFVLRLYPMLKWQLAATGKAGAAIVSALMAGKFPALGDVNTLFFSALFFLPMALMSRSILKQISHSAVRWVKNTLQYSSRKTASETQSRDLPRINITAT
jgi:putative peptide zinc metalloprotease protein